ncbi:MAG: hypothetical protein WCD00_02230, partial [Desulfuromonadaceae bacterium]
MLSWKLPPPLLEEELRLDYISTEKEVPVWLIGLTSPSIGLGVFTRRNTVSIALSVESCSGYTKRLAGKGYVFIFIQRDLNQVYLALRKAGTDSVV